MTSPAATGLAPSVFGKPRHLSETCSCSPCACLAGPERLYAARVGRSRRNEPVRAPARSRAELAGDLVADALRSLGYVQHTRDVADAADADALVIAELAGLAEQLTAVHLVALVSGGWCATCAAELTDPARSPSRARHCRACRVGWTLVERERRVRAVSRPWPRST